jgi:hypothetical protein
LDRAPGCDKAAASGRGSRFPSSSYNGEAQGRSLWWSSGSVILSGHLDRSKTSRRHAPISTGMHSPLASHSGGTKRAYQADELPALQPQQSHSSGGFSPPASAAATSSTFRNVSACNRCRLRKNRCDQRYLFRPVVPQERLSDISHHHSGCRPARPVRKLESDVLVMTQ